MRCEFVQSGGGKGEKEGAASMWASGAAIIMGVAKRLFYKIGHFSASHTLIVISAAVIVICICCIGFSKLVVTVPST